MQQDFTPKRQTIGTGLDSVVIRKCLADIPGGRTLDVTDWTEDVIQAGHIIAVDGGKYFPVPVSEGAYTAFKSGSTAKYAGVNKHTMLASQPAASIMTRGIVNPEAAPYKMTAIAAAFKADCPFISFEADEEA